MIEQQLKELVNSGLSISKIGNTLGKSTSSIRHWLDKYGLKTRRSYSEYKPNSYSELEHHNCKKCGQKKPIDEFYKVTRPGGFRPYSYCKTCSVEIATKRDLVSYKEFAVDYKGGKCEICGYCKCFKALEFHHKIQSEKEFSISSFVVKNGYSEETKTTLKLELDKCAMLCANCHREVHAGVATLKEV